MRKIVVVCLCVLLFISSCEIVSRDKVEGLKFYSDVYNTSQHLAMGIKFSSNQVVEMQTSFTKDSMFLKTGIIYADSEMNSNWIKKIMQKGCINVGYAYSYSNGKITIPEFSAEPVKISFFDNHILMEGNNLPYYKIGLESLNESQKIERLKKVTLLGEEQIKRMKYSFTCQ
ncbi:hypothetical protein [Sphingobacterium anhuiense]|uniref:hypothetical protein n=1 Tax=Sphingobacterium anhuiense TaxID=493780 RepID=UPI003C2B8A41